MRLRNSSRQLSSTSNMGQVMKIQATKQELEETLSHEGLRALALFIVKAIAAQVPMENVDGLDDVAQRLRQLLRSIHEVLVNVHQEMINEGLTPIARVIQLAEIGRAMAQQAVATFHSSTVPKH